jgi:uncharacterized NAD-dependent epimerase/dehydratase family protein
LKRHCAFLKIAAQRFEREILEGAQESLKDIVSVELLGAIRSDPRAVSTRGRGRSHVVLAHRPTRENFHVFEEETKHLQHPAFPRIIITQI